MLLSQEGSAEQGRLAAALAVAEGAATEQAAAMEALRADMEAVQGRLVAAEAAVDTLTSEKASLLQVGVGLGV